jgi:predicted restriction endonuclease
MIEVHHLRPLGAEHKGLDNHGNMLVLCPNHHALFDYRVPRFLTSEDLQIHGLEYKLTLLHSLDPQSIEYHNTAIVRRFQSRGAE